MYLLDQFQIGSERRSKRMFENARQGLETQRNKGKDVRQRCSAANGGGEELSWEWSGLSK